MKKILGMLLGIIGIFLLIQPAFSEMYMEQIIISDGNITQEQSIYSEGNINTMHYYSALGKTSLFINGVEIDSYETPRVLAVEQYIQENSDKWTNGNDMDRSDAASVVIRAVNYMLGVGRIVRDYEIDLAKALYSVFFTRREASQMYENLDARLAVWEKWVEEFDHDGYCHAKAMVAQERGYTDFHCHEDEWYHIQPDYTEGIRVEPYVPEE